MGLIGKLFGISQPPDNEVYLTLRNRALNVTPGDLGLEPDPNAPIHAVIMERGSCAYYGRRGLLLSPRRAYIKRTAARTPSRSSAIRSRRYNCQAVMSEVREIEENR